MKTKREMLKRIIDNKGCGKISCTDCPYYPTNKCSVSSLKDNLSRIGAMAILRMFPENKKQTFSVGTVIKFSDGKIAEICELNGAYYLAFGGYRKSIEYLIGRTWEVVKE